VRVGWGLGVMSCEKRSRTYKSGRRVVLSCGPQRSTLSKADPLHNSTPLCRPQRSKDRSPPPPSTESELSTLQCSKFTDRSPAPAHPLEKPGSTSRPSRNRSPAAIMSRPVSEFDYTMEGSPVHRAQHASSRFGRRQVVRAMWAVLGNIQARRILRHHGFIHGSANMYSGISTNRRRRYHFPQSSIQPRDSSRSRLPRTSYGILSNNVAH
jgi:hypothetical protein